MIEFRELGILFAGLWFLGYPLYAIRTKRIVLGATCIFSWRSPKLFCSVILAEMSLGVLFLCYVLL